LSLVLFVTDGLPSVGEQAPDRIAEQAAARIGRSRVFTMGIGPDVNTYLLDRLASRGRGTPEYVSPGAGVETAMSSLLTKLRFPALVDLRIAESPVRLTQTVPSQLPDLFVGEELVVFGRYQGKGSGTVIVTGQRNGRSERLSVPALFPARDSQNDFISRLWAARQIGELTRQIRLEGASSALVSQVRELGLRYGIVTEYTSYLVQEPTSLASPVPLREDQVGGPRNAAAQTGAEAVQRAKASAKLTDSKSLASAEAAAADRLESLAAQGAVAPSRRAGGRLFIQRGRVWTDVGQPDRITITDIAAYSRAYFDLVRVLPEIAPCLSVGDEILIAGRRVGVHIGPSGIEAWKPGQLSDLVRNFRGT
jgi:Ca-activated chloride channel family protein